MTARICTAARTRWGIFTPQMMMENKMSAYAKISQQLFQVIDAWKANFEYCNMQKNRIINRSCNIPLAAI